MMCRSHGLKWRTGALVCLLLSSLLVFSACNKATFEENYSKGVQAAKEAAADPDNSGKWERAGVYFLRAYRQSPSSVEVRYQLAQIHLHVNDKQGAYSLLREAEEKDVKGGGEFSLPIRIELARLFLGARQYELAQKRLQWVMERDPRSKDARALLAATLALQTQPDAAKQQVEALLSDDPGNLTGRALDATLDMARRDAPSAEATLQEEVRITNRSPESLALLANCYLLLRQPGKAIPLFNEAIQRHPQDVPYHLQLGWAQLAAGSRAAAEKTFHDVHWLAPRESTAVTALANYYVAIGDWPKAVAEAENLVKSGEGGAARARRGWLARKLAFFRKDSEAEQEVVPLRDLRDLLASVYYRAGRRGEALRLDETLLREDGNDETAHMLRGMLYLDSREFEPAMLQFDHVLHAVPDSAPAEYLLALAAFGAGKEQLALQRMEHCLHTNQAMMLARMWLMDYHLRRGSDGVVLDLARTAPSVQSQAPEVVIMAALSDPGASLGPEQQDALRQALLARPELIPAYARFGMSTLMTKYGGPLLAEVESRARNNPDDPRAQALLLMVLEGQAHLDEFMTALQNRVAANPKSITDLIMLARLQIRRREFNAARATMEKAAAIAPDDPQVMVRLAEAQTDLGDWDAALKTLDDMTQRYPKSAEAWVFKGIVYQQKGEPKDARLFYEDALKLDPNNAVAANNLALLMAAAPFKDANRAVELARKAHTIDIANPEFDDTLGWLLYQAGNYAEAVQALDDAVRMRPDDPSFLYHLGMAQSRSQRDKEALVTLQAAKRINPNLPEISEINAEIISLQARVAR